MKWTASVSISSWFCLHLYVITGWLSDTEVNEWEVNYLSKYYSHLLQLVSNSWEFMTLGNKCNYEAFSFHLLLDRLEQTQVKKNDVSPNFRFSRCFTHIFKLFKILQFFSYMGLSFFLCFLFLYTVALCTLS